LNVPVFPNNKSLSLVIHFPTRFKVLHLHCIISILGILGPKLGILYLSPFILSRRRFHLHLSRWRNLNRGICHTPIFDLRFNRIFSTLHSMHHSQKCKKIYGCVSYSKFFPAF
jgi:hypothetical protein